MQSVSEATKPLIEGVIYRPITPSLLHSDDRRDMIGVCNGEDDLNGFVAKQIKNMLVKQDCTLGRNGHFHPYVELYSVLQGEAIFDLLDPETGEEERIIVEPLHVLMIPGGIVHRAYAKAGTIISAGTSDFFVPPGTEKEHPLPPIGGLPYNLS